MSYSNGKSTSKIPYERSLLWSSFFLGFCLAIFIALGGVISSVVWACHGIDFSEDEPCPEVLVQHREVGRLGKILKRNKVIDYHVVRGNNAECACRYLNSFFTSKPASTTGVVDTCSPVVNDYSEVCFPEDSSKSQATMKYASAFTQEKLPLSASEINLITILGKGVESTVPHWNERSREVPWGGSGAAWFAPALSGAATSLEKLQGGLLYYSYLRIMKWPDNMVSTFPFKLCAKGCDAEFALGHTLHFRETYKPWLVSPTTIKENQNGYVYHHGFSPPLEGENGSHALIWIRAALRNKIEDRFFSRVFVNGLERGIAASLERSNGRIGKFNVVIDGNNFSWSISPSIHELKTFIVMLQDHFPDRLGVVVLANLGRIGEMLVGIVKPLISEEVRQKIFVLPSSGPEREMILTSVIGVENTPDWLGGQDSFKFDSSVYYEGFETFSDEEALKYIDEMPYHS